MFDLKKYISILSAAAAIVSGSCAHAQSGYITLKGYTDNADAVTALLLKKGSDIKRFKADDILYISQTEVRDNLFSVSLPLMDKSEYDLYSNLLSDDYLNKDKTIYLSSQGNDENSGESKQAPLKTFDAAYEKLYCAKEIVLLDDYTYEDIPLKYDYTGTLSIRGESAGVKLNIPEDTGVISLNCNLSVDNCVIGGSGRIYANGHRLVIGSGVTCENRISVFGGGNTADIHGNTYLEIYGGQYDRIYGGSINKTVYGDTYVTVGGNVNPDENINDNVTECYVFGAGYNGAVTGATYVTFGGNAKSDYVIGAGDTGNGTASKTFVKITGGEIMNVYGGANKAQLDDCETHIIMTGGKAEALFGGSFYADMTGSTCVDLFGGEITRRIYTGCYNNLTDGGTWQSSYSVNGTTTLRLKPGAAVVTKRDPNRGLFCGSRRGEKAKSEKNLLIYLDGCENEYKGYMGEKGYIYASKLKNYVDYTVSASAGGDVYTAGSDKIFIKPNENYYGLIGMAKYVNQEATLTSDITNVSFCRANSIDSVKDNITNADAIVDVGYTTDGTPSDIYIALYDKGKLTEVAKKVSVLGNGKITVNFKTPLKAGNEYIVKVFMWGEENNPLTSEYTLMIKK